MTTATQPADHRKVIRDYRELRPDYAFDPSIFNEEPEKVARVKEIIDTRLPQVDRVIFLSYVDCGSLRQLGQRLGLSYATLQKEIARIRKTILTLYDPTL